MNKRDNWAIKNVAIWKEALDYPFNKMTSFQSQVLSQEPFFSLLWLLIRKNKIMHELGRN